MQTEYKPITIPTQVTEAEGGQVIVEIPAEETVSEDAVPPPAEVVKPDPEVEAKEKEKKNEDRRKSRYSARVRQLNDEKQSLAAQLEAERKEKEDLKKQLAKGDMQTKESYKESLEISLQALGKQMAECIKGGDADGAVAIQDKMMEIRIKLGDLQKGLKKDMLEVNPESPVAKPRVPQVPEAALNWIENHPMFKTDPVFHSAALAVNNQLINEGEDPDDDAFYDLLSERLIKRFPEAFDIESENGVQLSKDNSSGNDGRNEQLDVKAKTVRNSPERDTAGSSSKQARTTEQTVSGSSRPSSATVQQQKRDQVTLTREEIREAELQGISIETLARRVKHMQENKRDDGYTPIMIPKGSK